MRLFMVVLFISIASGSMAQSTATRTRTRTKTTAPGAPQATAALTPASLHTDSLNYGDDVKRIYAGDFEHVRFARGSAETSILASKYMMEFADRCTTYLPKDKVEIMTQECSQEQWSVNGYGNEMPGSRHCISYQTVGTGKYADPNVYDLEKHLDDENASNMLGGMIAGMKSGDAAGGMRRMTDVAIYMSSDMGKLLNENGCASAGTMRFQANLIRFGWGKDPIQMPGGLALASATVGPVGHQNYKKLVDSLILDESQAWMMNRYAEGSAITSRVMQDAQGRPDEVDAAYSYMSMGKEFRGSVRVTFRNGTPECLYFSDFPDTCRAASPRVISAYERNQYTN
ncbi:MAG TPA: hypothetical protein VGU67_10585 [Edaphobacter sp.]|nr:hypothetical protein [Edaphobacter sp.]